MLLQGGAELISNGGPVSRCHECHAHWARVLWALDPRDPLTRNCRSVAVAREQNTHYLVTVREDCEKILNI